MGKLQIEKVGGMTMIRKDQNQMSEHELETEDEKENEAKKALKENKDDNYYHAWEDDRI